MPEDTPHPETPRPAVTPTHVAAIDLPELSPTQELPSQPASASHRVPATAPSPELPLFQSRAVAPVATGGPMLSSCLLYTSDAADERSSVDLGGRRIIKKK